MRNMKEYANTLDHKGLKEFAKKMGMRGYSKQTSKELLETITSKLESDRFIEVGVILGKPGKEGTAKVVWDQKDRIHRVKKQFRKTKSGNTLTKEAELQNLGNEYGLSPKVLEINADEKYIIMEMMEPKTLIDVIAENKKNGRPLLSNSNQREIIELFKKLDNSGIFHGDPNPLNFMKFPSNYKNKRLAGKFGLIDYGFGKMIKGSQDLVIYSGKPNQSLMTVGLLVILKKRGFTPSSFTVLYDNISKAVKVQFDLI